MFEGKSIRETEKELVTNVDRGLTEEEAGRRLAANGRNELSQEHRATWMETFFQQLNDPLIYVLLAAAAISLLLHEAGDAVIIIAVVLMNGIVGMIQEGKAQKALDSLKKLTRPRTIVVRDGRQMDIPAAELVTGDIVCLEAGRQVPADLRLVETINARIEESTLTGESVPVEKDASLIVDREMVIGDRHNMAFMSTMVVSGHLKGIVAATAMDTEIGKIASMIDGASREMTPLQKRLADMGKLLSLFSVLLCIALFIVAVIQRRDVAEMFITAISLAVAAVPEGLPAVVTIVLALSVSKMVKLHTIVRRLPSVETLGAVSVVCSDKTGTLTQNKMSVKKCFISQNLYMADKLEEEDCKELFRAMVLCNNAVLSDGESMGDPTEGALLDLAHLYGNDRERLDRVFPRLDEKPFNSDRRMMSTLHRDGKTTVSYAKGGAEEVLKGCDSLWIFGKVLPLSRAHRIKIQSACEEMAADALRVLAFGMKRDASRPEESGMIFLGMVGMMDPVRPEARAAVERFRKAGVDTVMITGDHVDTALAVGEELGIARKRSQCMSGSELANLSDEALRKKAADIRVFARVSPAHKVRIVKAMKANGKIVAMTGDGVNDAPSLKAADVGIAMGISGTDAVKNAADIILADDNFATIERAIEEGRGVYENIKKSVLFLLSSNLGEILTMFLAVICGMAAPLKAGHILWINLITDSLPALALGVDENDRNHLMQRPPRKEKESLFADGGLSCIIFYGFLIAAVSLAAFIKLPYDMLKDLNMELNLGNIGDMLGREAVLIRAQTYAFTVLGLSQIFHAVGMRDRDKSVFRMNHLENKLMIAAFGLGFVLQAAVTEVPYLVSVFKTAPLSIAEWLYLAGLAAFPLLAHEIMVASAVVLGKKEGNSVSVKTVK